MVHGRILVFAILAAASHLVMPYKEGPPTDVCESMIPGHGVPAQTGASPFEIQVNKNTIKSGDNTGVTVTVKVKADAPADTSNFEGVFVQARRYDESSNKTIGSFKLVSGENQLKTLDCTRTKGAVSHKSDVDKTSKSFNWIPPTTSSDLEVRFRGTFVQRKVKFWVNVLSAKVTVTGGAATVMASTLTALVLSLTSIVLV